MHLTEEQAASTMESYPPNHPGWRRLAEAIAASPEPPRPLTQHQCRLVSGMALPRINLDVSGASFAAEVTDEGPDIAGLEAVYEANISVPDANFNMCRFLVIESCGTTACMIGNFCLKNPGDDLGVKCNDHLGIIGLRGDFETAPSQLLMRRFRLTEDAAYSLFFDICDKRTAMQRLRRFIDSHKSPASNDSAGDRMAFAERVPQFDQE